MISNNINFWYINLIELFEFDQLLYENPKSSVSSIMNLRVVVYSKLASWVRGSLTIIIHYSTKDSPP